MCSLSDIHKPIGTIKRLTCFRRRSRPWELLTIANVDTYTDQFD